MSKILQDFDISTFQNDLVTWFSDHYRELPWRENKDPYRVWVSEIMLQQTRVDTVIPYYQAFMRQFPTLETLAYAEEDQVLKAWEGLGYYSRARNLQSAVREVVESYGGEVPSTRKEISKLKGVGPYTAGAILSIAYDQPEPAVDGNVMRVLSRVLYIEEDIAKVKTRTLFESLLYDLISKENPSFFNQGLMELGALVCTPTSPGCLLCPVRDHCRAFAAGVQEQLPIKAKKKKPKAKQLIAAVIRNEKGQVLIERRPEKGLLAKLWQFPNVELESTKNAQQVLGDYIYERFHLDAAVGEYVQTVEHVFSHLIWNIRVYEATVKGVPSLNDKYEADWVDDRTIENYAFPVSHQKIIQGNLRKVDDTIGFTAEG